MTGGRSRKAPVKGEQSVEHERCTASTNNETAGEAKEERCGGGWEASSFLLVILSLNLSDESARLFKLRAH